MTSPGRRRPTRDEYFEYYDRYVSLVPSGDIVDILRDQLASSVALLADVPDKKGEYRYQPGKWSTKEVVGHVIDVEWVFTYRALRFARGDATALPGIEQDDLVAGANFNDRTMSSLVEEFRNLRSANIVLFESLDETILDRVGMASGYRFTVRSIPYIIAGHERHHMQVLRERYL